METPSPDCVVLIEDSSAHAELVSRTLAERDPPPVVVHFRRGEDALAHLRQVGTGGPGADWPRLILLDLRLPGLTGIEVAKQIRELGSPSRLPVVVLTTSLTQSDVRLAYEAGVNSYVVKPMDYQAFRSTIRDLGTYWLDHHVTGPAGGDPQ